MTSPAPPLSAADLERVLARDAQLFVALSGGPGKTAVLRRLCAGPDGQRRRLYVSLRPTPADPSVALGLALDRARDRDSDRDPGRDLVTLPRQARVAALRRELTQGQRLLVLDDVDALAPTGARFLAELLGGLLYTGTRSRFVLCGRALPEELDALPAEHLRLSSAPAALPPPRLPPPLRLLAVFSGEIAEAALPPALQAALPALDPRAAQRRDGRLTLARALHAPLPPDAALDALARHLAAALQAGDPRAGRALFFAALDVAEAYRKDPARPAALALALALAAHPTLLVPYAYGLLAACWDAHRNAHPEDARAIAQGLASWALLHVEPQMTLLWLPRAHAVEAGAAWAGPVDAQLNAAVLLLAQPGPGQAQAQAALARLCQELAEDHPHKPRALLLLAEITAAGGDEAAARASAERALGLAEASGDLESCARACRHLSLAEVSARRPAQALLLAERAAALARRPDFPIDAERCPHFDHLAQCALLCGDTSAAALALQECLAQSGGQREDAARAYQGLAALARTRGDLPSQQQLLAQACAVLTDSDSPRLRARLWAERGVALVRAGLLEQAAASFVSGLEVAERARDVLSQGHFYHDLAGVYRLRRDSQHEVKARVRALQAYRACGASAEVARQRRCLGRLLQDLGAEPFDDCIAGLPDGLPAEERRALDDARGALTDER